MLGAVLAGLLITVASLACGQAVMLAAGRSSPSAVAPAAGMGVLLVVCGIAVKLPGHAVTAAVAAGLATAVAAGALLRERGALTPVRAGFLVTLLGAALVTAIPFAASGRMGILGQGLVNDDMASHLLFTEWLTTHVGQTPDLVRDGYPLGPHAAVAAAAKVSGASFVEGFAGLTGALAALTALTAYGALRGARSLLRAPAALLVAFAYLAAAYLAQGAFKEPMLALGLLGFSLSLAPLRPSGGGGEAGLARAAIPAGVIAAGTIYNYSFPGLAWLAVSAAAWLGLIALRERRQRGGLDLAGRLSRGRRAVWVIAGLPAAAAIPELFRLASFTNFKAFNPGGTGPRVGFGNLRQPLSPLESLGIWPSSEFRITPARASSPELAFYAGALIGLAVLAWGLYRALKRREAVLPAALVAGAFGYLAALAAGTPYTQAKALAIASPVVMLIGLRGLLRAGPIDGEERDAEAVPGEPALWARPLARLAIPALGAVFAVAAAFSSLLPLRQAAVGPEGQVDQLISMRPLVQGQKVLFLGRESFVAWELIGADVYAPIVHNYNVTEIPSLYRANSTRAKFDFDVVSPHRLSGFGEPNSLGDFDYVITTRAAQQSEPPPEFEPIDETRDYVLWRRTGPPTQRRTLIEPTGPGSTVDCTQADNRAITSLRGRARVFSPRPVVVNAWKPTPEVTDSQPASEELLLGPGRWRISLQYASTRPMHVRAGGLDVTLAPNLLFRGPGPYYPVGEIEVRRGGLVRFDVSVDGPPLIGRLLGAEMRAYLGPIAATPDPPERTLPLSRVCGKYLDWYRVAPGTPPADVQRVEHPTPHAVVES
jgi:hypothetical protein